MLTALDLHSLRAHAVGVALLLALQGAPATQEPPTNELSCEWIELVDELLPESMRDPAEWKWVGFKTQTRAGGRFALELRDARELKSQIGLLVIDSLGQAEVVWACGIKASNPCAYAILRGTTEELKLVMTGSIPTASCPGCSTDEGEFTVELPFEELWRASGFGASHLKASRPFTFAVLSWNGKVSSGIARSKFKHPWFTIPAGSSSGFAGLDSSMKRLLDTDLRDWPHPVLAWTAMLLGEGDEQRVLDSRKL